MKEHIINGGHRKDARKNHGERARIYKEGWTERAIILLKLYKSLLESSKSVCLHKQKSLYSLKNPCI